MSHISHRLLNCFRIIPLGGLDLLQEIRLEDEPSVVNTRLYHVLVSRRDSKMTAAVYRGRNGEEEWRRKLQTYCGIQWDLGSETRPNATENVQRHPNTVQIYGVVSSQQPQGSSLNCYIPNVKIEM
ncbi:hypothetical protein B0H14DRAFT_2659180 [Mycena olivaceomarginata]|nr:hypothetical protein B0H14DRAFT_2659180 [Mycena olivaceomarginata]